MIKRNNISILVFMKYMKNILTSLVFLFNTFLIYSQGAICLYVNGDGVVVCSMYSNSGGPSESNCRAEARASNPACGLNMSTINVGAGSCASQIFVSPPRCLDDVSPHNITTSTTQVACETAGDRWCPSSYYGFFVGNSGCQNAICNYANGVLPVELIDFKTYIEDDENHIEWSTASEHNTSHYIINHSTDGLHWTSLGQIPAAGNSNEIIGYNLIHKDPSNEINYYVLIQFDINGDFVNYGPISIDNRSVKSDIISVTNILGQPVDDYYKGLVIIRYSDGVTKKVYL